MCIAITPARFSGWALNQSFFGCIFGSALIKGIPPTWNEEGDLTLKPSAKMVGKVHEALANKGEAA